MEGESADVKGMVPVIVEVDNCCDEEKVALRLDIEVAKMWRQVEKL